MRIAAAVPMGTEMATTAMATRMVLRKASHIRTSWNSSMNQRSVKPTHG